MTTTQHCYLLKMVTKQQKFTWFLQFLSRLDWNYSNFHLFLTPSRYSGQREPLSWTVDSSPGVLPLQSLYVTLILNQLSSSFIKGNSLSNSSCVSSCHFIIYFPLRAKLERPVWKGSLTLVYPSLPSELLSSELQSGSIRPLN